MRFIYFSIVTIAVLAQAEKVKDKRLAIDANAGYRQSSIYSHQPTQHDYLSAQAQQQYYQPQAQLSHAPQQQDVTYTQPISKYSTAAATPVQKYTYSQQPKQQIPYSSAADVSSFSYNSPIVSYSNLGLLKQIAGQQASGQDVPVSYNTEQSTKAEYSSQPKVQYVSSPKSQFSPSRIQYSSSPKVQYTSSAKSQYVVAPSGSYSANAAPNYDEIYQQIAQKAAYAAAEQQQQSHQQQKPSYQQSAPQKLVYQQSSSPVVYQFQKNNAAAAASAGQGEAYSPSSSQQYSYQLPQEYESSAQSDPQVYYSQSSHAAAPSPQYYTLGSQGQGKAGVTYSS